MGPVESPVIEQALIRTGDALYAHRPFNANAVRREMIGLLVACDENDPSASQQLALTTLLLLEGEMTYAPEDGADPLEGGADALVEIDGEMAADAARQLLAKPTRVRDLFMAHASLRHLKQPNNEGLEMVAANQARVALRPAGELTPPALTRHFARRVLCTVAQSEDEVLAVIRQAQQEGNDYEVMRLVGAAYPHVSARRAIPLLAIGVNAAEDVDNQEQVYTLLYAQFSAALEVLDAVYNAAEEDRQFFQSPVARGAAETMVAVHDRFAGVEGLENGYLRILCGMAYLRVISQDKAGARRLYDQALALAKRTESPQEFRHQLELLDAQIEEMPDEEPPLDEGWRPEDGRDSDDDPDDPTTRADWWKK